MGQKTRWVGNCNWERREWGAIRNSGDLFRQMAWLVQEYSKFLQYKKDLMYHKTLIFITTNI